MRAADLGAFLLGRAERAEVLGTARQLEDDGCDSLWIGEAGLLRDPHVHAAAAAAVTERLGLGIGLANVRKQLPAALASATATLDTLAPGRCVLVIGPWREPTAVDAGAAPARPLATMREGGEIVKRLLRGETVTYAGEVFSLTDTALGTARDVPLLWAANRPRMVAAAAEAVAAGLADGVMVNFLHSVEETARVVGTVTDAAVAAGRDPATLRFPTLVMVDVDDERAAVERMLADVRAEPALRAEVQVDGEPTPADIEVRMAAGTARRCAARIDEYLAAGAGPVVVFARDVRATLRQLLDA